jgi:predicted aspartyl protease
VGLQRSLRGWLATLAALVLAGAVAGPAAAKCQLQQVAELHVLNDRGSPQVQAQLNGQTVPLILDTGGAQTLLLTSAAKKLHLPLTLGPNGMWLEGVGGRTQLFRTTVDQFSFGGASVHGLGMLVAGERPFGDSAGLLGWDLLSHWDVEFDLAHHAVRLLRPVGCHGDEVVYWSDSYHRAAMLAANATYQHVDLKVSLNGREVDATLDSGASVSTVTPEIAARAGARVELTPEGGVSGVGSAAAPGATVTFSAFDVAGEEIRNPRLRVADMFAHNTYEETGSILEHPEIAPEMLLGADFLRAHRVLIASDQGQVYFTYVGGPVFVTPSAAPSSVVATPPAR